MNVDNAAGIGGDELLWNKQQESGKYHKVNVAFLELGEPGVREIPISKTYGEAVLRRLVPIS